MFFSESDRHRLPASLLVAGQFGLLAILLVLTCVNANAQERPNIIFIVADDLGYGDLSCYGSKTIATPNLDKLAAGGIRFTQAYAAAPVCTPSRTGFMTGRYPARTAVGLREPLDWTAADSAVGLSPQTPSLPALLRQAGYHTCLIGKWHLGFTPAFSPRENGFDHFFGYHGGGVDYASHTDPQGRPDLYENETTVTREGYLTDILAAEALLFIRGKHDRPFFLSLQFNAPHWPWQGRGDAAYPRGDQAWKEGGSSEVYAKMVSQMDEAVGRVMEALAQSGLAQNTLVVFTSDNGGERFSDMGGLRDKKMTLWEGGIRVPAIFCWPSRISGGKVSTQPIIHLDFTATFLALAGAKPDPAFPLDGLNIMHLATQDAGPVARTFYWRVSQRRQQYAMRQGDWKYLVAENDVYLFNLATDPFENKDLKAQYPARLADLQKAYASWEQEVLEPLPPAGKKAVPK
ncbi:MAG: sulfatase [Chitinophagaceae bacterium]|nr:sulfatase [Chitinophagaceae bacterium]